MKLVRSVSLFIALAGASTVHADTAKPPAAEKAPAKPVAKAELSKAEAAKVLKFFNQLVDAIVKHQDSCPAMATAINRLFDQNEGWLTTLVATGKELPQATKDKLTKRQSEMMGAAMKCKDDQAVNGAMARFAPLGAAKKKPARVAP